MAKQQIIAGIDVGSSKVATVIAGVTAEEKLKVIGVSSVPSKGIRKGQIVNIEEASGSVIESVEAAERMAGYNLNRVFVSVGGQHIASQNSKGVVAVAQPEGEISEDDVERVIEAARAVSLPSSREIVHVVPRAYVVDGQEGIADPIGMSGVRLEAETHIITGASTAIKNLTKCVGEVGANVEGVVCGGLASAEAVLTETEKELGVILVDIGGGTTDIVIFVEGSPSYTTVLPVGAKNVTNDLAIGLRVPLEAAEKIKKALGEKEKREEIEEEVIEDQKKEKLHKKTDELELASIGIKEDPKRVSRKTLVEGIIKPRLYEIFTMVGLEIKKSGFGGLTPSGMVLCGGGAMTVGITDAVKRTLSMPVRVGSPQGMTGLVDEISNPQFATLVGLALYGIRNDENIGRPFESGRLRKVFEKLPVKGFARKLGDLIKSLLP